MRKVIATPTTVQATAASLDKVYVYTAKNRYDSLRIVSVAPGGGYCRIALRCTGQVADNRVFTTLTECLNDVINDGYKVAEFDSLDEAINAWRAGELA